MLILRESIHQEKSKEPVAETSTSCGFWLVRKHPITVRLQDFGQDFLHQPVKICFISWSGCLLLWENSQRKRSLLMGQSWRHVQTNILLSGESLSVNGKKRCFEDAGCYSDVKQGVYPVLFCIKRQSDSRSAEDCGFYGEILPGLSCDLCTWTRKPENPPSEVL